MHRKKIDAFDIFAAVFSQKRAVSDIRLLILKTIYKSKEGTLKFSDILKAVQSYKDRNYSSQRLTYDLNVLKENALVDQTSDGSYSITDYGCYILDVYDKMRRELEDIGTNDKPGFVGGANGFIVTRNFDYRILGQELWELPFFRKVPSREQNKINLEWNDSDDNFESDIEISSDGSFTVHVVIYVNALPSIKGAFKEDLEKTAKWHNMAKGMVQAILYYIERTARRLWNDCRVDIIFGPDSYPINLYAGVKEAEENTN